MDALTNLLVAPAGPRISRAFVTTTTITSWTCSSCRVTRSPPRRQRPRLFSASPNARIRERKPSDSSQTARNSHSQPASKLSHTVSAAEQNHFDRVEAESKAKQIRSPWMRDGSETPPVARPRSAGAMTKGKLLTTPSRMLKLILPLTTRDRNRDRKDVEPLALLVHPQQPLSYLERLIQSELPVTKDGGGEDERGKIPAVSFRAQDTTEEDIGSGRAAADEVDNAGREEEAQEAVEIERPEETMLDGKVERTGKIKSPETSSSSSAAETDASLPLHAHSTSPSPSASAPPPPPPPQDPAHPNFVRWSPSTEIGDFIRDASRAREFAVDIEGAPHPIYVGVPSFTDRTYYLRMRLRKASARILQLADIKHECDELAHRGAKRVAQGGFMALVAYWGGVYYLTFKTDLGWDVMEPITYLVGLTGLMGGYMWFLYHNREASYRSALNFTVSRRQSQLYEQKGFDLGQWEMLVEEGNRLRREIKMVAEEYDVEWDESRDEGDEKVRRALREERQKKKSGGKREGKDGKEKDEDEDRDKD